MRLVLFKQGQKRVVVQPEKVIFVSEDVGDPQKAILVFDGGKMLPIDHTFSDAWWLLLNANDKPEDASVYVPPEDPLAKLVEEKAKQDQAAVPQPRGCVECKHLDPHGMCPITCANHEKWEAKP